MPKIYLTNKVSKNISTKIM